MLASLSQIVLRQEIVKNIEITSRLQERNQRFRAILGKNAHSAFYLFNNILNLTSLTVMTALSFYLRNSRESPRFTSSGSIFQVLHF